MVQNGRCKMVAAGDRVRVSFEGVVHKVALGNQIWVLVNGGWFATDEWEPLEDQVDLV